MKRLVPESMLEELEERVPVDRYGKIEDLANAALSFASDAASFVHGESFVVDGGSGLTGAGLLRP
jgi:NAD(P)-dependent dehydrogenase (short-subunit alcohol dehydrogenase family)